MENIFHFDTPFDPFSLDLLHPPPHSLLSKQCYQGVRHCNQIDPIMDLLLFSRIPYVTHLSRKPQFNNKKNKLWFWYIFRICPAIPVESATRVGQKQMTEPTTMQKLSDKIFNSDKHFRKISLFS